MTEVCEFGECEVSIGYGALKWCRGKLIGKGGFGSVYIAKLIKPTSENTSFPSIMAVKSDRATDSSSPLMNEGKVLEALKGCPCVIQTYGSDITTNNKGDIIYNLFMEFASLGSLTDSIIANPSAFSEKLVRLCTQSILIGLRDIHGHGFVHCDIKPDNILFVKTEAGYKAKVADFGLAKRRNVKSGSPGVRGTSWFYSPVLRWLDMAYKKHLQIFGHLVALCLSCLLEAHHGILYLVPNLCLILLLKHHPFQTIFQKLQNTS